MVFCSLGVFYVKNFGIVEKSCTFAPYKFINNVNI